MKLLFLHSCHTDDQYHTISELNDASVGSGSGLLSRYFLSEDLLSLTISPVYLQDEGLYTLTASNPAGEYSASIQLTVYGARRQALNIFYVHVAVPDSNQR